MLLRDELGAAPAPEVQALHAAAARAARPVAPARPQPPPAAGAAPERVPLPSVLAPRERSAFVGRERELEALRAAWHEARAGSRRLVLRRRRAGDRQDAPDRASSRARRTPTAPCSTPAARRRRWSPTSRSSRRCGTTRAAPSSTGAARPRPGRRRARAAVPELAAAATRRRAAADPETRRYLLFEAVSTLLAEARRPARRCCSCSTTCTGPTARRCTCCATSSGRRSRPPLLIVGTYREAEVGAGHPLADAARRPAPRPALRAGLARRPRRGRRRRR